MSRLIQRTQLRPFTAQEDARLMALPTADAVTFLQLGELWDRPMWDVRLRWRWLRDQRRWAELARRRGRRQR